MYAHIPPHISIFIAIAMDLTTVSLILGSFTLPYVCANNFGQYKPTRSLIAMYTFFLFWIIIRLPPVYQLFTDLVKIICPNFIRSLRSIANTARWFLVAFIFRLLGFEFADWLSTLGGSPRPGVKGMTIHY